MSGFYKDRDCELSCWCLIQFLLDWVPLSSWRFKCVWYTCLDLLNWIGLPAAEAVEIRFREKQLLCFSSCGCFFELITNPLLSIFSKFCSSFISLNLYRFLYWWPFGEATFFLLFFIFLADLNSFRFAFLVVRWVARKVSPSNFK